MAGGKRRMCGERHLLSRNRDRGASLLVSEWAGARKWREQMAGR